MTSYVYDELIRSTLTRNGATTTYSPNALNQYTAVNGATVEYDTRFNVWHIGGLQYDHDAANRLVAVNGNGHSGSFTYDGLGRCVRRTIDGITRLFAYDGWNAIFEWDEAGAWKAINTYGARPDEILSRYDVDRGLFIYKHDNQGNVTFLLNGSSQIVERYSYDAFGQVTVTNADGSGARSWSNYGNRFSFTGREWISELGIYDYRHRFYSPTVGRFLETDPLGLQTEGAKLSAGQKALFSPGGSAPEAFASSEMNLYRYCGDDPVDSTDPLGLLKPEFGKDSALEADFNKAQQYLSKDPGMRDNFKKVEDSSARIIVERTNGANVTGRIPGKNTIVVKWNPRAAAFFPTTKGVQSPAMGLGHEVAGHVERMVRDPNYKQASIQEEMRVINKVETPATRNLPGEGTRVKYEGRYFPVDDVLSTKEHK